MRFGEVAALRWQHINLQNREILVVDPKNGETRAVHMTEKVQSLFNQLRQGKIPDELADIKDSDNADILAIPVELLADLVASPVIEFDTLSVPEHRSHRFGMLYIIGLNNLDITHSTVTITPTRKTTSYDEFFIAGHQLVRLLDPRADDQQPLSQSVESNKPGIARTETAPPTVPPHAVDSLITIDEYSLKTKQHRKAILRAAAAGELRLFYVFGSQRLETGRIKITPHASNDIYWPVPGENDYAYLLPASAYTSFSDDVFEGKSVGHFSGLPALLNPEQVRDIIATGKTKIVMGILPDGTGFKVADSPGWLKVTAGSLYVQQPIKKKPQRSVGKKKSSRHPGYLRQAVEAFYDYCIDNGDTELLRENNIQEFIRGLKHVKTNKKHELHEYIDQRIESISDRYIKTADEISFTKSGVEKTRPGRRYQRKEISTKLSTLRGEKPF
jgi:hypothetical protein